MNMKKIALALSLLLLAALACNAPGGEPTEPPPTVTPFVAPETATEAPQPTNTPAPSEPGPTNTPKPTATNTPAPGPTATLQPISEGPLEFPKPTRLDSYQQLPEGGYEATIVVRISGGAPPFTIRHDMEEYETWERDYPLVFRHSGCGAMVHTITVESADGQTMSHDYWIPAPWCATPSS